MSLTPKQLEIASMINEKVQVILRQGGNDLTVLAELADHMPRFKQLLESAKSGDLDELIHRFEGFSQNKKILKISPPA